MSKSKQSNKILLDDDATYFCAKCGQAGFKTNFAAYGHLTNCKGFKSVVAKAKRDQADFSKTIQNVELNQFDGPSTESSAHYPDYSVDGLNCNTNQAIEGHPRATLSPLDGPPSRQNESDAMDLLIRQNNLLKAENRNLEKAVYNHGEHMGRLAPTQNFSGPADMINQSFGEIWKFPAVRMVAMIGAGLLLYNFVDELLEKIKKRHAPIQRRRK